MNLEKYSDRAKGFLQSAQTVAIRMNHQRISSDHLLKALLDDNQGMNAIAEAINSEVNKVYTVYERAL